VPDWDNQQALVIFEQMLTAAGGDIDAAVAANDGLAGAVIAALQNQGLPFIPVTGQDATVGGIQNILAGRQSMTVYKAIKAEAEAAANLAVALLRGEDTSMFVTGSVNNGMNDVPAVLLVPVPVTADNIAETVIADGFRTWEEICVGEFAMYCPEETSMDEGSIAVLLPDSASSARWEADDRRFFELAFEAAGVDYTIVNAEGEATTQLSQAEQAITNGAKVILMVNLDSGSGASIIELARANGVAIIDYDRLTIEGEGADFYVSFDNESVGRLQGEGIVAAVAAAGLEQPVRVAVLNGSPTDNNATLFKNGYDGVINSLFESGEWEEVADQSVPDWDNQQALVIFEQAFEAAGADYTIVNAEGEAATQFTQAEQAITNGAKVILMVNLDSGSGASIIELARANGVAIIDYDRLTIEGEGADFYVSFDNESVGRLQGEGIVAAVAAAGLEQPVRVAVLNGSPTDNNATLFKNGYDGVINSMFESGEWEEVADQSVPDWDNQQALVIFEQMLTAAGGDIDAAVAANDGLAGAVIAALQNQGLPFIPVTGQDATVGGIQNILAGRQSMTVYKAIKAEAEAAASLAVALLRGDDTSMLVTGSVNNGMSDVPSVLLVPVPVTIDNIAETVIADGFRSWEEICVGEFEELCPPVGER
jgi:D-xylose transport system substrate-binding protein